MNRDVVSAENELMIASNKLVTYAEFLTESIETYIDIVHRVGTVGIQSEQISAKLSELVQLLSPYRNVVLEEATQTKNQTNKSVDQIADADKFKFPDELTSVLRILINEFL